MFKKLMFLSFLSLVIISCGGGGGGGTTLTTATGQFKDSNTSGISYVSGAQSGITAADGTFTYEVGKTVTFSVGGVTIGTASGKSVVTPIDLVTGGSSTSVEVQNIVRFLLMLDKNGDPSDGIQVSPAVRLIAATWLQVNFKAADLSAELASIISDAASVDGTPHTLLDALFAKAHMESTLLCSYAGAYKGSYSGSDNGNFGFVVDAFSGRAIGLAYSIPDRAYTLLSGSTPISYDQNVGFISGSAGTGATFSGRFTSVNNVSGNWAGTGTNGSFSGSRIGGVANATYRFTGDFRGGDFGLFSFDVSSSNTVTGVAYSIATDELLNLSGRVTGTRLTATVQSSGTSITGTINLVTGTLRNGFWNNSVDAISGSFSGSGCKLN